MAHRVLPALLALAALLADLGGHHGLALVSLLAAIPAAFALTLDWYGDAVQARGGGARPLLAGCGLALLVLSAALRSPAVVGGVPRLAVSALVLCLLLYGALALSGALAPGRDRLPAVDEAAESERLADAA